MHKKIMAILGTLALILTALVLTSAVRADATDGEDLEPCVPADAYTETIEHPAVTHEETIHHDAVTQTTPAIWEVWSPNNTEGPQDYVPTWPSDERGTWQAAAENIPAGHEGPDGVYQQGPGNSPFFYRQAEKVTVLEEAYDEVVVIVDEEAYTEVIEHLAVTCDDDKKVVVCKYTGTPPGGLSHIVIVSENTLNNVEDADGNPYVPGQFPFSWTDAHGQTQEGSVAIRYATEGEQAHDVSLDECPGEVGPEELSIPAEPDVSDPCGVDNAEWMLPDDDATFDWELDDGELIVTILTENTVFEGTGETTYNFGEAVETVVEECEVAGEQLEIPAEPGMKDPCGAGNATWVVPADSDELDWTLTDGVLSVEITVPDTVFGGTEDTSYSFGKAVETNRKACEVKGEQGNNNPPPLTVEVKGEQAVPAAIPTAVDAGLGVEGDPLTGGRNPLWLLVVGGGLGFMGSAGWRRRASTNR